MANYISKTIKISDITPNGYNPNTMTPKCFNALCAYIATTGYLQPLLVNDTGGVYTIIDGEHRYKALQYNHIEEVECWVMSITPVQARKLTLEMGLHGDYKTEDLTDLINELLEDYTIEDLVFDIPQVDFDSLNIKLDDELGSDDDLDDDIPEEAPVVSKRGDIWLLGNHRIMCGDSVDEDDVALLMDGIKADMCFTDPPYGVDYDGEKGNQFKKRYIKQPLNRPKLAGDKDTSLYTQVVPVIAKYTKGPCYVWRADNKSIALHEAVEKAGTIHSTIIWVKDTSSFNINANYKYKHESCLYWKPKGCTLLWSGSTTQTSVWEVMAINSFGADGVIDAYLHPTQKPVKLAEIAINNHTADTVLDLFLGSGSTLIGAHKAGRICYGMELEPRYIDIIVKRYANYIGNNDDIYLLRDGVKTACEDIGEYYES